MGPQIDIDATMQWQATVEELVGPYRSLDPSIVLAIIYIESRGDPTKRNPNFPAVGLMGVVGKEGGEDFADRPSVDELVAYPQVNIEWGIKILAYYRSVEGSLIGALYRYSGGVYWGSFDDFVEKYWKEYVRVLPLIEAERRQQKDDHGWVDMLAGQIREGQDGC